MQPVLYTHPLADAEAHFLLRPGADKLFQKAGFCARDSLPPSNAFRAFYFWIAHRKIKALETWFCKGDKVPGLAEDGLSLRARIFLPWCEREREENPILGCGV